MDRKPNTGKVNFSSTGQATTTASRAGTHVLEHCSTPHLYSGSSMGSKPEMLILPDMVLAVSSSAPSSIQIQSPDAARCWCYPGCRVLRSLIFLRLHAQAVSHTVICEGERAIKTGKEGGETISRAMQGAPKRLVKCTRRHHAGRSSPKRSTPHHQQGQLRPRVPPEQMLPHPVR